MLSSFKMVLSNGNTINENSSLCSKCASQVAQTRQPKKFMDNNLNAGSVPECIQKLDVVQRRLISQIQCFMTIIILPGGQYAEKGLAIHFPLDIESYIRSIQNVQNEKQLIITHTNIHTSSWKYSC